MSFRQEAGWVPPLDVMKRKISVPAGSQIPVQVTRTLWRGELLSAMKRAYGIILWAEIEHATDQTGEALSFKGRALGDRLRSYAVAVI